MKKIKNLEEPIWERQEGEEEEWYQKFMVYYLGQSGDRTVPRAVERWAMANNIWNDAEIRLQKTLWNNVAEKKRWVEREVEYEIYSIQLIKRDELEHLKDFKSRGLRMVAKGTEGAIKSLKMTTKMLGLYEERLEKTLEDYDENDEYTEEFGAKLKGDLVLKDINSVEFANVIKTHQIAVDTCHKAVELGEKMLGLQQIVEELVNQEDNTIDI